MLSPRITAVVLLPGLSMYPYWNYNVLKITTVPLKLKLLILTFWCFPLPSSLWHHVPLSAAWVQWPLLWIQLPLCREFLIQFLPFNSSILPLMFPHFSPSGSYWLLNVVNYHSPLTSCRIRRSFDLPPSRCHICFDLQLHYIALLIFKEPGYMVTCC